jgi:hypothetical protein
MTKKQNLDGNPSRAPLIDLKELDRDVLTNKVHRGANFAKFVSHSIFQYAHLFSKIVKFFSVNECWHSLKLNDFDPEKAIRRLKIERLIEIGVATDKDLAESALDSCQWDISAAVDRLIS